MTEIEVWITIILIAAVTFLLRVLPFLFFKNETKLPAFIVYLGKVLPYSMMGLLVVYCFKSVSLIDKPHGIPEMLASLTVFFVHTRWHNMLCSIASGTVLYMFLVQRIF